MCPSCLLHKINPTVYCLLRLVHRPNHSNTPHRPGPLCSTHHTSASLIQNVKFFITTSHCFPGATLSQPSVPGFMSRVIVHIGTSETVRQQSKTTKLTNYCKDLFLNLLPVLYSRRPILLASHYTLSVSYNFFSQIEVKHQLSSSTNYRKGQNKTYTLWRNKEIKQMERNCKMAKCKGRNNK